MKLSRIEKFVLDLLSWGKSYPEVLKAMEAQRPKWYPHKPAYVHAFYTMQHLHSLCGSIRKKTGIRDTKDPDECREWSRKNRYTPYQQERGPTRQQMSILHHLAAGKDYATISKDMHLSMQACLNLASQARKRAKLKDSLPSSIRAYFSSLDKPMAHPDLMVSPPTSSPVQPQPVTVQNTPVAPRPDPMDDPAF